jgi:8-oxo-dGTP diphosphatase
MELYLVRHAHAGSRRAWDSDDRARPLSKRGERQAQGIAKLLDSAPITRVFSSPALRCVQTVAPLAENRGLEVEINDQLFEGSWVADAISFAESLDETVVFSSHGDVIPQMLRGLVNRGLNLLDDFHWAKGSTWVINRDGEKFTDARYLPPTS